MLAKTKKFLLFGGLGAVVVTAVLVVVLVWKPWKKPNTSDKSDKSAGPKPDGASGGEVNVPQGKELKGGDVFGLRYTYPDSKINVVVGQQSGDYLSIAGGNAVTFTMLSSGPKGTGILAESKGKPIKYGDIVTIGNYETNKYYQMSSVSTMVAKSDCPTQKNSTANICGNDKFIIGGGPNGTIVREGDITLNYVDPTSSKLIPVYVSGGTTIRMGTDETLSKFSLGGISTPVSS